MTDKKTILVWSDVINLTKLTKILTRKKVNAADFATIQ